MLLRCLYEVLPVLVFQAGGCNFRLIRTVIAVRNGQLP
jgi:hypothetical protein